MLTHALLAALIHAIVFLAVTLRILSRRNAPGVSMAWLLMVLLVPVFGAVLYIMIGERRLGRRWIERAEAERERLQKQFANLSSGFAIAPAEIGSVGEPVARLASSLGAVPVMGGHRLELHSDSLRILDAIVVDIDACRERCSLEFYIWNEAGQVRHVIDALLRAAARGVKVTALMDGLGSRPFIRSEAIDSMREAGIEVVVVLPASALRMAVARADLRNHRKIAVFDDRIAWTGSFNLVDPREFKREAGVGQWIDAMLRIEGPCCELLGAMTNAMAVMQEGQRLRDVRTRNPASAVGSVALQPYPSGPGFAFQHVESVILTAIFAARRQLVLTTPYFAPGDAVVTALRSAARRGVEVMLIVPMHCDSRLVQWASASYFDELLAAGVAIHRFDGGLLHTKSMVIDESVSIFGTVNFDLRSFHLNFELSMLIYDPDFAQQLIALQRSYLDACVELGRVEWGMRSGWRRMLENAAQLASPLL